MLGGPSDKQTDLSPAEEAFAKRAEAILKRDANDLDDEVVAALNSARSQAEAIGHQPSFAVRVIHNPNATALAAACVIAVGVYAFVSQPAPQALPSSALELVLLNDDFDLLTQDLEFYDWVAAELDSDQSSATRI